MLRRDDDDSVSRVALNLEESSRRKQEETETIGLKKDGLKSANCERNGLSLVISAKGTILDKNRTTANNKISF